MHDGGYERGRESIGPMLSRLRTEAGISQLRLAQRLCAAAGAATVTRHEVSRWERELRLPSGYWLAWLAVALDVPVGQLERAGALARRRRRFAADLLAVVRAHPDQLAAVSIMPAIRSGAGPLRPPTGWVEEHPGVFARAAAS